MYTLARCVGMRGGGRVEIAGRAAAVAWRAPLPSPPAHTHACVRAYTPPPLAAHAHFALPARPPPPPPSFLLQLALLDLACSAFPPSTMAAGALSAALQAFGRDPWPVELQSFGSYLPHELAPCRERLHELQATLVSSHWVCLCVCGGWGGGGWRSAPLGLDPAHPTKPTDPPPRPPTRPPTHPCTPPTHSPMRPHPTHQPTGRQPAATAVAAAAPGARLPRVQTRVGAHAACLCMPLAPPAPWRRRRRGE